MVFRTVNQSTEDPMSASCFVIKYNDLNFRIHNAIHCGDALFLTCDKLDIKAANLRTNKFEEAVSRSKTMIWEKISALTEEFAKIKTDNDIEFTRY